MSWLPWDIGRCRGGIGRLGNVRCVAWTIAVADGHSSWTTNTGAIVGIYVFHRGGRVGNERQKCWVAVVRQRTTTFDVDG
jgi:hypothetical protein